MPTQAEYEAGADAIHKLFVKTARDTIGRFTFDVTDLPPFVERLMTESETAQVLIFYSYLDDRILAILKLHLFNLQAKAPQEHLFGINGPLSTFSSRVLMAYHLGWLSDKRKQQLDAFRKMRNEFAHRAFKVTSSDPLVVKHLNIINFDIKSMMSHVFPLRKSEELDKLNSTLCRLIFLALLTFQELLLFPVAISHKVLPSNIIAGDDAPELHKNLIRECVKALFTAANL